MFRSVFVAAAVSLCAGILFNGPAHADAMGDWKRSVAQKIADKQTYPRSALSREIEGRAKVRIEIAPNGEIVAHEVVEATGETVLDREIPRLVERLNPLPALPSGESMTIVLPLTWALN